MAVADVAPAAPTATVNTAPFGTPGFGQAPSALGMGVVGGLAGLGLGVPGLGTVASGIGAAIDAANLNDQLGMMGLAQNIDPQQAAINAMSMGAFGRGAADQFGQTLGFDALAEAPMSAFSAPQGLPDAPPDTANEYALLNEQLPTGLDPLTTPTTSPYNPAGGYVVVNGNIVPRASLGLLG
jgi:hypothetical protein